jgi:hypothetical protein
VLIMLNIVSSLLTTRQKKPVLVISKFFSC